MDNRMRFPICSKLSFDMTNNVSKDEASILGLRFALDIDICRIAVYKDLNFFIMLSTEEYIARDTKFIQS